MSANVAIAHEPGVAKPDPVLTIDGMSRAFGGLRAVDIDHLEIQRNTITSIIGPNGAGKTTLFNLLTGFEFPDHGTYSLDGEALIGVPAYRRGTARHGQDLPAHEGAAAADRAREHAGGCQKPAGGYLPRCHPGRLAQRGARERSAGARDHGTLRV